MYSTLFTRISFHSRGTDAALFFTICEIAVAQQFGRIVLYEWKSAEELSLLSCVPRSCQPCSRTGAYLLELITQKVDVVAQISGRQGPERRCMPSASLVEVPNSFRLHPKLIVDCMSPK